VFEQSKQRRRNFYALFLPSAIPDRAAAINAIVAGTIAGLLLTAISVGVGVMLLVRLGVESPRTVSLFAMILASSIATVGTWKHYAPAAITGLFAAIAFLWWAALTIQSPVLLLIVGIPVVGGFWAGFRGIVVLKRLSQTGG
jgi:hypothetical protein